MPFTVTCSTDPSKFLTGSVSVEQVYFSGLGIKSGNVLFEDPLLFYFGGNSQSIQLYDNQGIS